LYSAIVFLPLLGAILAGIIAVVGAASRNRAGEAPIGAEDHQSDPLGNHARAHEHAAPVPHHASRVDVAHHEPHGQVGHDAHGDDHPSAQGSRAAELVTSALLVISAILSWIAFFDVGFGGREAFTVPVLTWIHSGNMEADWALRIDTLTVVMLVVVTTVSAIVHIYSIGYMAYDPHRPRFMAYLSLFTFAMLMLVTADNLLQMFFGWEGVGLASYLLIGFWYTGRRPMPPRSRLSSSTGWRLRLRTRHLRRLCAVQLDRPRHDLRERAAWPAGRRSC
jgi:NADH-quinone oxidoreductase subunit L